MVSFIEEFPYQYGTGRYRLTNTASKNGEELVGFNTENEDAVGDIVFMCA